MTALFTSPEFGETTVGLPTLGSQPALRISRLRLEIFEDDGLFELFLIDRAYEPGREPQDLNVTLQGVFTTLLDALHAMDQFILDYNRAHEEHIVSTMSFAMNDLLHAPGAILADTIILPLAA